MPWRFSELTPTAAIASAPSQSELRDARKFAKAYWNARGRYAQDRGCNHVQIWTGRLPRGVLGEWEPAYPCTISLTTAFDWSRGGKRDSWWQICATTIHEYGHLVGMGHIRRPNSIMAPAVIGYNNYAEWWPWFPGCRYQGDDPDGDGQPDW